MVVGCRFSVGIVQFPVYIHTLFWLSGNGNLGRVWILYSVHCCTAVRLGMCTDISSVTDRTPHRRPVWEKRVSKLSVCEWLVVFNHFLLYMNCAAPIANTICNLNIALSSLVMRAVRRVKGYRVENTASRCSYLRQNSGSTLHVRVHV